MKSKPDWLKKDLTCGRDLSKVTSTIDYLGLNTVCVEARCPNKCECWGLGTATFMVLGDICTRGCRYCAVKTASCGVDVDETEPQRLVEAAKKLGLKYVVLTSVDRDDLDDLGSNHFAKCIKALKDVGYSVEALIPDYVGENLKKIIASSPDVLAHNIEVVERFSHYRDPRATYQKSLECLKQAKELNHNIITKSSIMMGFGENEKDVRKSFQDLLNIGCTSVVLGQYLQPTRNQIPVIEYVTPEIFQHYGEIAKDMGFKKVVSQPLARTSYMASLD